MKAKNKNGGERILRDLNTWTIKISKGKPQSFQRKELEAVSEKQKPFLLK